MRNHLPVLIAAGLLAAVPGHAAAQASGSLSCVVVAESDNFSAIGTGYAPGHLYFARMTVPHRTTSVTPEGTPQGNLIVGYEGPGGTLTPGTYSVLLWSSQRAYRQHAATVGACSAVNPPASAGVLVAQPRVACSLPSPEVGPLIVITGTGFNPSTRYAMALNGRRLFTSKPAADGSFDTGAVAHWGVNTVAFEREPGSVTVASCTIDVVRS